MLLKPYNTPILDWSRYKENLIAKDETQQIPGGNKAYVVESLLRNYINTYGIFPRELVESTSGNTGLALAEFCYHENHTPLTLFIPHSIEKDKEERLLGYTNVKLVKCIDGDEAAIFARDYARRYNAVLLDQYNNTNGHSYFKTVVEEILTEVSDIEYFVCGIGTGQTIVGMAKAFKYYGHSVEVIGVVPEHSFATVPGLKNPKVSKYGQVIVSGYSQGLINRFENIKVTDIVDNKFEGISYSSTANILAAMRINNIYNSTILTFNI